MIDLKYSLIIEATDDPNFFGFYSPELEGFTGVGGSVEDCLYKARWDMQEKNAAATVIGAMRAAHDIQQGLHRLNATCEGLPCPIRIGGGINSGAALLGSITRSEYTAHGDANNLAFRFETASKELRTDMVIGSDSCRHLPARAWEGRLAAITVKGKAAPQQVWPLTFAELESVLSTFDTAWESGRV